MRKFKKIALLITVTSSVIFLFVFARNINNAQKFSFENLSIEVDDNKGLAFLEENDIKQLLINQELLTEGMQMSELDYEAMETAIESLPEVKNSEVSATVDGRVEISTVLRVPVMRVIHQNGMSNYIDENGEYMPVSRKYTARVPVFTGNITESSIRQSYKQITGDEILKETLITDDLYEIAMYIRSDEFLSALIEQVDVDNNNELVLIPKIGDHKIVFGKVADVHRKFTKLKVFYREGLGRTDWNMFEEINLKYQDQIVCTRKTLYHQVH